jgi:hypothetical protein
MHIEMGVVETVGFCRQRRRKPTKPGTFLHPPIVLRTRCLPPSPPPLGKAECAEFDDAFRCKTMHWHRWRYENAVGAQRVASAPDPLVAIRPTAVEVIWIELRSVLINIER